MDLNNKTAMEIRSIMKEQGWDSHDSLAVGGWINGYVYSIWFERFDWHGRDTLGLTGHHVCFHRHTNDLNKIDYVTRICAEQCLKAYEDFIDCVPFQNCNDESAKDVMLGNWNDPRVLVEK